MKDQTVPYNSWQAWKIYFTQESIYILNEINEQDTPFPDLNHKHMMKSGAPPVKVRVLYRLLPVEFHVFTSRIDFEGLLLFGYWPYLNFFKDGMGPFKNRKPKFF